MKTNGRYKRIKTYRDSKFGIFMHWGPMSGYRWNKTSGLKEDWDWINSTKENMKPFVEEFKEKTKDLVVDDWFKFFNSIGVKYFSFVVRHCFNLYYNLYPSKVMDFCSERDYLKEISESCRKNDINLIVYQPHDIEECHKWWNEGHKNYESESIRRFNTVKERLGELTQKYDLFGVWFDGWPGSKNKMIAEGFDPYQFYDYGELAYIARKKNKDLILGNKEMFEPYIDYVCSEQFLCDHFGNPLCGNKIPMEVNETLPASIRWFSTYPEDTIFLSDEEIEKQQKIFVKRFFSVIGRGLNYLLNVGPLPNGQIPTIDKKILEYLGKWVNKYSETIYGTEYYDAESYDWGYIVKKGDIKYLYVLDNSDIVDAITCHRDYSGKGSQQSDDEFKGKVVKWQKNGTNSKVFFKTDNRPSKVILMNTGKSLDFSVEGGKVYINMNDIKLNDEVLILKVI